MFSIQPNRVLSAAERLTSSHYDSTNAMYKLYQINPSMVLKLHPYYEIS